MKNIIVFIGSMLSSFCFMYGMDMDLHKTHSRKEKSDKKGSPHFSFHMSNSNSPKTHKSPNRTISSSRKDSVEDEAVIPKIGTPESLRLALEQQRAKTELKKSQERPREIFSSKNT